jgi:hypothetical protein
MKTRREQSKEEIMVIKLFACNYAKDLLCITIIEHYRKMLYGILNIRHSYYVIYMNKQLVFGVIAVVFATALIASLVVDQANAFSRNNQRSSFQSNSGLGGSGQSISEFCSQDQSSSITTAGGTSPVSNSGTNMARCDNTNNGGNAAS